jgi:antitoxin HicB
VTAPEHEYTYTILLDPDEEDGGYTVTVPALPGCVTQGATREAAIALARDAIRGYLEALAKDGRPLPEEHAHPQALTISVAA